MSTQSRTRIINIFGCTDGGEAELNGGESVELGFKGELDLLERVGVGGGGTGSGQGYFWLGFDWARR